MHDLFLRRLSGHEFLDDCARAHDQHAVAHAEYLFELRGNHQDRGSRFSQLVHQAVNFLPGADVDAPGRLIEQEDARLTEEPLRQDRFLLISATQRGRFLIA